MGKTPDPVPRKRRTPLSEDLTNTVEEARQQKVEGKKLSKITHPFALGVYYLAWASED
jgi:hypothetical protein